MNVMTVRPIICLGWLLLAGALLWAADPPAHQPPPLPAEAREVSINDLEKLLKERKDIAVLDVRSVEEVNEEGHLPGAKHVDQFRADFEKVLPTLGMDMTKPCVVYCEFGGRARRAAERMAKLGFKEILLPAGGFNAWKKAGKPVEGGPPPKAQP